MKYTLYIEDNSSQEESRREKGSYSTYEEATIEAKKIVDEFLVPNHTDGVTADDLFKKYLLFGEDTYIVPEDGGFSAHEYAKLRCGELCRG